MPAKYWVLMFPFAFGISVTRDADLLDEVILWGEGDRGEGGAGEWLPSEYVVGEVSAMGDDVFHPKKEVSLFGPGDLGVFVIIVGSEGS